MTEEAECLRNLNRRIREAATEGNVEKMIVLGETRRQFLDALPIKVVRNNAKLVSALEEAVHDNKDFIQTLEGTMQHTRARGKITSQARRRYHKTQTIL